MVKGFTTIGDLQRYWRNYENAYLRSISSDHYQNLFEPLSNVYSYMLEYQVRAVCHLSGKQLSRAWQKVAGDSNWSGKEAQIVKLSDRCAANIAPLQREEMVQILAAQNKTLEQIGNTENSILKMMKDDRQKDAEMEFLRALHSAAGNYKGGMEFNADSVKGTCEWFFADETFSTWRDASDSGVFWLTAGPGCGKSVLARTLIKDRHLQNITTTISAGSSTITNSAATVCYFFFKDDDVQRTKTTTALSALLHQLFCHEYTRDLIEHALPAFGRSGNSLTRSFEDLWSALITCAENMTCGNIVCVLDAMDECNKQDRDQLIRKIDGFYDDGPLAARANLKFLITSRAYGDIERSFRPMSKRTEYFRFDADGRHKEISHDIGLVIDAEMESFASEFNDGDREKIAETLKSKGTKTYLWLHLTLRILKADPSQYSRRRDIDALLAEVPDQVSEAYEKLLNKTTNESITSNLLHIALVAARPLTLNEANYALTLALEEDSFETHAQLETGCWSTSFETVVKNFSGLLLSIYDDRLSFIHLTAQEYLVNKTEPDSPNTRWGGRFADVKLAHGLMSRCCIRYLLLPELASRILPLFLTQEYPLLEYAANYWPEHFEEQDAISKQSWIQQARHLCRTSEQSLKVWGPVYRHKRNRGAFFGWTDLSVAAWLGLFTVVGKILDDGAVDLNEYSAEHGSALNASIDAEENMITELLISRGADVEAASSKVYPPLLVAAMNYNGDILSLLLANGASPLQEFTFESGDTTTVLRRVAEYGLAGSFYTLMSALVDISTPDKVLEALANESFVHCGKGFTVLLCNLLPDEKLEDERFLNHDMLQTLLFSISTHERALQLIVEKKRQDILLEPSMLGLALRWPDSRQIVQRILQEREAPCESITQDVLEECVRLGCAELLKTFFQYCPRNACDARGLLRVAVCSIARNVAVYEVVMDNVGEYLHRDEHLQDELLETARSPEIIPAFLRLPRCTVRVARRLVQKVLKEWHGNFAPTSVEGKRLITRVLDHCTDKGNVIDANLLADGAEYCDRETFLWLVELSDGVLEARDALLEAAAKNEEHGQAVMEFLLHVDDVMVVITPHAVLAAATNTDNHVLEWLLEKHAGSMTTTVEPSPKVGDSEAWEMIAKRRASQIDELAVAALRIAAEDWCTNGRAVERLIPYCASSLDRPSEDFILGLLDRRPGGVEGILELLFVTVGKGIALTERVLAKAACCPWLLEMIRNWRPEEFKVTSSLIAMIAANGHDESLDYLAQTGSVIGQQWYRCARLHNLLRWCRHPEDAAALKELWAEGDVPDVADANGRTALHIAAEWGAFAVMPLLVQVARPRVDAEDRRGRTALHLAVGALGAVGVAGDGAHGVAAIKALVLAGADPQKADRRGRTPLAMAEGYLASGFRYSRNWKTAVQELLAVLNGDEQVKVEIEV